MISHKLHQNGNLFVAGWSLLLLLFTIITDLNNSHVQLVVVVQAFPSGAGGCMGNMAAVGGSHIMPLNDPNRPITNNTLQEGSVTVTLISSTSSDILSTGVPLDIFISTDYTIQITSTAFPMRGILIRVEVLASEDEVDTATVQLTPGLDTQNAIQCIAPILGTTHIDSSDKNEMTSTIRSETTVENVILDITGVFINGVEGSVYVYSQYIVNFVSNVMNETIVPSTAPVTITTPTIAPKTGTPTITPTVTPTTTVPISSSPTTTVPTSVAPTAIPTTETPTMTMVLPTTVPIDIPINPSDEPSVSIVLVTMETTAPSITITPTIEPSLRGGGGKGMGMGGNSKEGKGVTGDGGMMSTSKGMSGKGGMGMMTSNKVEQHDMKKSKDKNEHVMSKISKDDKTL